MINPLLTKLVCSRRLGTSLVPFLRFYGPQGKKLGQYPAILPLPMLSNPYCLHFHIRAVLDLLPKHEFITVDCNMFNRIIILDYERRLMVSMTKNRFL